MQITFWGVRGSTPTPDADSLRYGGNTACVEVRTPEGHVIIVDGGTGIIALGKALSRQPGPRGAEVALLLSHLHWDHIQGLPFFSPLYDPRSEVHLYGSDAYGISVDEMLDGLMRPPYFPVDTHVLRSRKQHMMAAGQRFRLWDVEITALSLNHPQGCLGFRFEASTGVFVYASDHEHGNARYDAAVRDLARGADLLVYDAQYTPEEYPSRRGWGHSTWAEGVSVARDTGARRLMLFHHDPGHSDTFLDGVLAQARSVFPHVDAASEGACIRVEALAHRKPARAVAQAFLPAHRPKRLQAGFA